MMYDDVSIVRWVKQNQQTELGERGHFARMLPERDVLHKMRLIYDVV
jgi:hypothetical protein